MAFSKTSFLKEYSGKVGNQFVLKRYGDKSVICALPKKNKRKKRTPKQIENNLLMTMANHSAKAVMKNPAQRNAAQLQLNVTLNKLYTSLVRLYFQQTKLAKANGQRLPIEFNFTR